MNNSFPNNSKKGFKGAFEGVDKVIFGIGSALILGFVLFMAFFTEGANTAILGAVGWCQDNLSWLYALAGMLIFLFCIFLCFSKYGKIKLGKEGDEPEFKTPTWIAMLFSAAMGVAIIFFGAYEPVQMSADFTPGEGLTEGGIMEAMRYVILMDGVPFWSVHALMGIAIGYFAYRKGLPEMVGSTLSPLFGEERCTKGGIGRAVDLLALLSTIIGIAAAIGVCTTQLMGGLESVGGVQPSMTLQNVIIAIITITFLASATTGLKRGIKYLSNFNFTCVLILFLFVMLTGPFTWIMEAFVQFTGAAINDYFEISTFMDLFGSSEQLAGYDIIGSYPIMYVAWYSAWACFTGSFVARISRGRTIRATIAGVLLVPGLFGSLWFVAFGGTGIHFEFFDNLNLSPIFLENAGTAMFALFEHLPGGGIASILGIIVAFTLLVTTCDSTTLVAAVYTCEGAKEEPRTWVKFYWGLILGLIAIFLLPIGGVQISRQLCLILAIPIIAIMVLQIFSLMKAFKKEKFVLTENGSIIPKE